jgi:Lar family restriction alleviation protein
MTDEKSIEELKPCPLCGGTANEVDKEHSSNTLHVIICTGCDLRISKSTREKAVGSWNKRAAVEAGRNPILMNAIKESKVAEKEKPEIAKYKTLQQIVDQLEWCNYECEAGSLKMNTAFIALKQMALDEVNNPEERLDLFEKQRDELLKTLEKLARYYEGGEVEQISREAIDKIRSM